MRIADSPLDQYGAPQALSLFAARIFEDSLLTGDRPYFQLAWLLSRTMHRQLQNKFMFSLSFKSRTSSVFPGPAVLERFFLKTDLPGPEVDVLLGQFTSGRHLDDLGSRCLPKRSFQQRVGFQKHRTCRSRRIIRLESSLTCRELNGVSAAFSISAVQTPCCAQCKVWRFFQPRQHGFNPTEPCASHYG